MGHHTSVSEDSLVHGDCLRILQKMRANVCPHTRGCYHEHLDIKVDALLGVRLPELSLRKLTIALQHACLSISFIYGTSPSFSHRCEIYRTRAAMENDVA